MVNQYLADLARTFLRLKGSAVAEAEAAKGEVKKIMGWGEGEFESFLSQFKSSTEPDPVPDFDPAPVADPDPESVPPADVLAAPSPVEPVAAEAASTPRARRGRAPSAG